MKDGEYFIVCAVHLIAYEERYSLRYQQLQHLMSIISKMPSASPLFLSTVAKQRICIMGDFNYHLPVENKFPYDLGYVDCWRDIFGGSEDPSAGYTWDGRKVWYLP